MYESFIGHIKLFITGCKCVDSADVDCTVNDGICVDDVVNTDVTMAENKTKIMICSQRSLM